MSSVVGRWRGVTWNGALLVYLSFNRRIDLILLLLIPLLYLVHLVMHGCPQTVSCVQKCLTQLCRQSLDLNFLAVLKVNQNLKPPSCRACSKVPWRYILCHCSVFPWRYSSAASTGPDRKLAPTLSPMFSAVCKVNQNLKPDTDRTDLGLCPKWISCHCSEYWWRYSLTNYFSIFESKFLTIARGIMP